MSLEDLHEKRGVFVKAVREAVSEDLLKNGLDLESASLTQLDQTAMEYFNPSNAFDAEGLTRLTQHIEQRKKERNDVEQNTLIAIRSKNLETEKLALMDAFLPGVAGWEAVYNAPNIWHFRFNGEYPEKLVQGRERTYFEYFWNVLAADKNRSIPEADRKAYTEAYAKPGRMRAAWAYFASWPQLAKDFAQLSQTRLTMPVLSIGGEKSLGNELGEQTKLVAENPTVIVLPNTGHWILEEQPKETMDTLVKFLQ